MCGMRENYWKMEQECHRQIGLGTNYILIEDFIFQISSSNEIV